MYRKEGNRKTMSMDRPNEAQDRERTTSPTSKATTAILERDLYPVPSPAYMLQKFTPFRTINASSFFPRNVRKLAKNTYIPLTVAVNFPLCLL